MLLDLAACVSPRINIMDAVVGMEGNGPHSGEPRRIGLLLGSFSALALDVVAGAIMGLPKASNPVLIEAARRGLAPVDLDQIELEVFREAAHHQGNVRVLRSLPGRLSRAGDHDRR